jgi:hypothetical protein
LIESTARGARAGRPIRIRKFQENETDSSVLPLCLYTRIELKRLFRYSQSSLVSDASDQGTRHLAVVFFDVLMLDSSSLLSTPYTIRRSILESLIEPSHGQAMLAERTLIALNTTGGIAKAEEELRKIFARVIADHQEGIILKAENGAYNDCRSPWVKVSSPVFHQSLYWLRMAYNAIAEERLYSRVRRFA